MCQTIETSISGNKPTNKFKFWFNYKIIQYLGLKECYQKKYKFSRNHDNFRLPRKLSKMFINNDYNSNITIIFKY